MNTIKTFSFLLLISIFLVGCEKEEEIHPCDIENHIVATWDLVSYLDIGVDADGNEVERYEGNSGNLVYNSDGTGTFYVVYTTGGSGSSSFSYEKRTVEDENSPRRVIHTYTHLPNLPLEFVIMDCAENSFTIETEIAIGSVTHTETMKLSRRE